jgi:hypothetical protein
MARSPAGEPEEDIPPAKKLKTSHEEDHSEAQDLLHVGGQGGTAKMDIDTTQVVEEAADEIKPPQHKVKVGKVEYPAHPLRFVFSIWPLRLMIWIWLTPFAPNAVPLCMPKL